MIINNSTAASPPSRRWIRVIRRLRLKESGRMPSLCADKSGGIPMEQRRNSVYGENSAAQEHTDSHFSAAVLKSCNNQILYLFCLYFSLFSLWNYPPCVYPTSFKGGSIPCSRRRGWLASLLLLPPSFSSSSLQYILIIWSSHGDKKGIWVTLLGSAKLKLAPNPTELFALISQSLLVIVEWRAAPSHLCRPLQHSESMSQKYIKIVNISL